MSNNTLNLDGALNIDTSSDLLKPGSDVTMQFVLNSSHLKHELCFEAKKNLEFDPLSLRGQRLDSFVGGCHSKGHHLFEGI